MRQIRDQSHSTNPQKLLFAHETQEKGSDREELIQQSPAPAISPLVSKRIHRIDHKGIILEITRERSRGLSRPCSVGDLLRQERSKASALAGAEQGAGLDLRVEDKTLLYGPLRGIFDEAVLDFVPDDDACTLPSPCPYHVRRNQMSKLTLTHTLISSVALILDSNHRTSRGAHQESKNVRG
ncbi:hypothetical protein BHM03_00000574 [Ensete ventricosum]|uniref:Uncharacterized protein n=1 Tax=Ensete ventricosum TaxID=4639 RepID=A0A445M8L3_ENSVE|nr:hypothetical protein BHM03_00000574 [Ensete ventricosum]